MKLYLIVRADLVPAQQAVQAAHALQEFNLYYPQTVNEWVTASNTLALLSVPNEKVLDELASTAGFVGIDCACFREPDLKDSLTAIALGPAGKPLTRGLPLALQ